MRFSKNKKITLRAYHLAIVAVAVLLIFSFCTGIYAYLKSSTSAVENSFDAAENVSIDISETFENQIKSDVKVDVGDTGYSVYVRAAIVAYWEKDGKILPNTPTVGIDYTISLNTADWFLYNGYYYYRDPVESGKATNNLINQCKLKANPADGCKLVVKIVSQTIQSAGTTNVGDIPAVTAEWGVTVNSSDKKLEAGS